MFYVASPTKPSMILCSTLDIFIGIQLFCHYVITVNGKVEFFSCSGPTFLFQLILNCVAYLEHPWIREDGEASDKPIDSAVLSRMKQFRAMNKLKKLALKVSTS